MPANDGTRITMGPEFIGGVKDKLDGLHSQVAPVRGGVNPNDSGHPRGFQLATVQVVAGGEKFPPGADLKAKANAMGGLVDEKLRGFETKLSDYGQALQNIIREVHDIELTNMSLTDFGKYMPGGGTTSPTPPPSA
ncbi:hypothetical protein ACIA5C_45015 [Actinoplanes sp. NPDC051343]|uniref:hypothetical protein n=1 Tax=Actinoplanes sp. NPDC051343 TaxID=3363906 RepID=UPI0037B5D43D